MTSPRGVSTAGRRPASDAGRPLVNCPPVPDCASHPSATSALSSRVITLPSPCHHDARLRGVGRRVPFIAPTPRKEESLRLSSDDREQRVGNEGSCRVDVVAGRSVADEPGEI